MIRNLQGTSPKVAASAYIDDAARVIGDVEIGERSSIWPMVVLRGDIEPIRIGEETNIQDGAILHTDKGYPCIVGNRVSVGHGVMLHGCTVGDDALIGIGAIVLTGSKIGAGAVVAAGALVPEGMEIAADTLVMGAPAKPRRAVSPEERERFRSGVINYAERAQIYKKESRDREGAVSK